MQRTEVNLQTGEQKVVQLTAEEIAQAEAQYAKWEEDEVKKREELPILLQQQIEKLQAQLDAITE